MIVIITKLAKQVMFLVCYLLNLLIYDILSFLFNSLDILIPIILMITLLFGNAVIVWVLLKLKRKHKMKKTTAQTGLLNSGKSTDV